MMNSDFKPISTVLDGDSLAYSAPDVHKTSNRLSFMTRYTLLAILSPCHFVLIVTDSNETVSLHFTQWSQSHAPVAREYCLGNKVNRLFTYEILQRFLRFSLVSCLIRSIRPDEILHLSRFRDVSVLLFSNASAIAKAPKSPILLLPSRCRF